MIVQATVFEWRGPAPFHFIEIAGDEAEAIAAQAAAVTYGWGMVPVSCRVGSTTFTTSLWPKAASYYLPLKDAVRRAEHIDLGDEIVVEVELARRDRR